ncbi:MAG: hypothetical protein K6G74_04705 [Bacilli bacterium]|nr:hypothetical protein [Bacilli bacterium]
MKKNLSKVMILSAALLLASCQKPPVESKASESVTPPTSQTQSTPAASEGGASESVTSQSTPAGDSTPAGSQTVEAAVAFTGIDIIEESNKVTAKITGTISGFANADAMKMAFGLVQSEVASGETAQYIMGSATPADADYKYAPTVNATAGTFELKVDLSGVTWAGGTYTAMCGPKGYYAAVGGQQATGITYGTGKVKTSDYRISVRSHNGTIAADELPPVELTISKVEIVEVEDVKHVIHTIGGAINTNKLSEADFLAMHPYLQYEHINDGLGGGWKKNVMGSSTKTDLVTVAVEGGNALIKVDVTDLPIGGYNIKINLNGDSDVDTKMDAVINGPAVINGTKKYVPFADSSKTAEADLYGNCGLYIKHEHAITAGEKAEDSALRTITCVDGDITGYELRATEATSGQLAPSETGGGDNEKKTRLGKDNKFDDVWDISGIASGEYEVYLEARCSSGNANAGYWNSATAIAKGDKASNNGGTAELQSDYKYKVKVDNGAYENLGNAEDNYAATGINETTKAWTTKALANIMINEGAETLTIHNMNNGYAIWVYAVRLVRVGNYLPPATNIVFDANHAAKIEAEDYSVKHTIFTNTGEETDYTTDGTTYPADLSGSVEDDANASGGKYVHAIFREGWNGSKRSNMSGELVYRVKLSAATTVKVKAKIKSDMTTEKACLDLKVDGANKGTLNSANAWVEAESSTMELTAGVHTISFVGQQLGQSEGYQSVLADIDWFQIIDATPAA